MFGSIKKYEHDRDLTQFLFIYFLWQSSISIASELEKWIGEKHGKRKNLDIWMEDEQLIKNVG